MEVTVAKAYREVSPTVKPSGYKPIPGKWAAIPPEKPEFCPAKLKAIAARIPEEVDADWLARRSKIRVDNRTPASFLHAIFRKGEHVLVFTKYRSQGQTLWTHPGVPYDARNARTSSVTGPRWRLVPLQSMRWPFPRYSAPYKRAQSHRTHAPGGGEPD